MSRPGGPTTKNWTTNNLRNWLVSQVAGGLLFRFGSPRPIETNRIGCQMMRSYSRSILRSFNLT
jgi:hypothetical protein